MLNNTFLFSVFSILLTSIGLHQPSISHSYTTINGDTINLEKSRKRFKAILYLNEKSCTGCKEEIATYLQTKTGYEWWLVTQCNSSIKTRTDRTWYFESIFKNSINGVLFDINNNSNHENALNDTRMFRHYNITTTPAVVLIDTKCNSEEFIHYNIIYSDVYISDKFKKLLLEFRKNCPN